MEFNTIDQFLTTLEGPVESSGSFSLNLNSARQKLESYQLPDPGLYPIFLVAAAVPSGATEFDVWTDSEKIRFEFNGSPFQVDELQALKGFLFASGETPPRLSNLAIALTAARQLSSTFEFRSGQALLSCSEEGWTVRQEQAIKKTRLIIPRHQSFLAKWKSTEPDLQDILSVCRFAPLTFRFNAEYAGWHWSFRLPVIHRVLRTDCTELRMGRLPQAYGCHTQTVDSPGPYGGAIALVRDDDPRDLQVVVDGISHPIPIQAHGMEGVIWHDGLTRDLSCTQLIHDQKMEDFLRQLEAQIDDMVYERVSSSEAFHAREREVLEPLAEKAAAHYSGLGDEDKAERILLWVQAEEQDLPDLSTSCGFAELTTRLTELTEASHGLVLQSRAPWKC